MSAAFESPGDAAMMQQLRQVRGRERVGQLWVAESATPDVPRLRSAVPSPYQGFAGEIVGALEPSTEADPMALLATVLAIGGAIVGDGAHLKKANMRHAPRSWLLIVGPTGNGRKGTSYSCVAALYRHAFPDFMTHNVIGGLSSGEGLIANLQDRADGPDEDVSLPSPSDKRRLIREEEFGRVLAAQKREGNTLSAVLRGCWDGTPLQVITRTAPLKATEHSVTIIGHVTADEFREKASRADLSGGLYNRFLLIRSRKSKSLPDMPSTPLEIVEHYGNELRARLDKARWVGRVELDPMAQELWRDSLYHELNPESDFTGRVGEVLARAVPNVLRLSLGYALLDGAANVRAEHLHAAHGFWSHVEGTAKQLFKSTTGNADADLVMSTLKVSEGRRLDRTQLHAVFGNNKKAAEIERLVGHLTGLGLANEVKEPTAGAPRVVLVLHESDELTNQG